jgi:hypothetical protein
MARTKQRTAGSPSIVGDVTAESITINAKGGSLTAILKRGVRGNLVPGKLSYGAKIEFEPGVSCVLVAPGQRRKFRVAKIANGFVVTLEGGEREVVDPTTKAVLAAYEEMLKAGKVKLLSTDEAERRFTGVLEKASKLEPATKQTRKEPAAPK